ncbi:hypothetical protein E1295_47740 [Nonomuraea mesophila]|uniref:Uncharacterized protein n=1 Tax=Nonomuraea mesophila TaxID=2530382 RepID=A0A4R5DXB1_9ACTN|nr:hypothetical protein [Nonomuraea mesophila]TDE19399.1 hypothetical protein E1295_47740 [Nonomuraea mesophila]
MGTPSEKQIGGNTLIEELGQDGDAVTYPAARPGLDEAVTTLRGAPTAPHPSCRTDQGTPAAAATPPHGAPRLHP